jgi:hypothetical protein
MAALRFQKARAIHSPHSGNRQVGTTKVTTVDSIKFLGLTLDNSLSWGEKKKHIEAIVPKLRAATFGVRVVQPFLS